MPVTTDPLRALLFQPPGQGLVSWAGAVEATAQPTVLTYALVTAPQANDMLPLPEATHEPVRLAFRRWAEVSGLSFVEIADDGPEGGAMIRLQVDPEIPSYYAAWALPPPAAGERGSTIGIQPDQVGQSFAPGSFMFATLLHEIGHAIGLKHPFEGAWTLTPELDNWNQTVLSYTRPGGPPVQPGPLDVAAVQYLYGSEAQEAMDGLAWSFDAAARRFTFAGSGAADALSGTFLADTLRGGAGDDRLHGLRGADILAGGPGADRYWGGEGDDIILAGADGDTLEDAGNGYDWLDYSEAGQAIRFTGTAVASAAGTDTLRQISALEALRGSPFDDSLDLRGSYTLREVDGGAGWDTALLASSSQAAGLNVTRYQDSVWLHGAFLPTLKLAAIERLAFRDTVVETATLRMFDPLSYIATHADLRAALGADAQAGLRHWLGGGAAEGRTGTGFAPFAYLASHADLAAAYGADPTAAATHYIRHGAAEGRRVDFAAWQYLASHADLRAAFGADPEAAARHYLQDGRAEGRAISFGGLSYIASHDDLIRALGGQAEAGGAHYVRDGAREGRGISFDPYQYIASHADLIAAFGTDAQAGTRHFIGSGFGEGRARDSFDAAGYLARHADLQAAFGARQDLATLHYIQLGHAEGRTDHWA